jgi:hypothetical protein
MRNRPKASVLAVYPAAVCCRGFLLWYVWAQYTSATPLGKGATAFAAWHNAQENTKGTGK